MKIAVYCGSTLGKNEHYQALANELGHWMASNNHPLIYGGGNTGLMGTIANAVLENNGQVIGVMPTFLMQGERAHQHLTEFIQVETMSERKQLMLELSDICIALPGGPGTLEEIVEAISWLRIKQSTNPCIFFNVQSYYNHLELLFDHMVHDGFLNSKV